MPPKKQKQSKAQLKAAIQPQNRALTPDSQNIEERAGRITEPFKCICGKVYGSLAAVHTHINNKHTEEKKKYKAQIINPKKSGQPSMTSIRMKDINYNEIQAELMCLADINLKAIYQLYSQVQKNLKDKDILIDVNEDLSDDSDLQIQGAQGEVTIQEESKRRKDINLKIKGYKDHYKMEEIIYERREDDQLATFKQEKFKLNLISELSKFFVADFAAKIEFSLLLIHVSEKQGTSKPDQANKINTALDQIWQRFPKIKAQLIRYYKEWNKIRNHYKSWKQEQSKNDRPVL